MSEGGSRTRERLDAAQATDAANARKVDPRVAKALAEMTAQLARPWTVASLARVAGMSRAAFARRFLLDVGTPPLRHLGALRLARGARLLVDQGASLAEVSSVVGYASEFAFSRAFKRLFGEAPAVFRRRMRTCVTTMRAAA